MNVWTRIFLISLCVFKIAGIYNKTRKTICYTSTRLIYRLNNILKLSVFSTCFRALNSEVTACRAVRLQTCSLCIWHRKLLLGDGKFVHPFAVEFVRIQYVNDGKGNLVTGRHCHSTVLGVQHLSQRKMPLKKEKG